MFRAIHGMQLKRLVTNMAQLMSHGVRVEDSERSAFRYQPLFTCVILQCFSCHSNSKVNLIKKLGTSCFVICALPWRRLRDLLVYTFKLHLFDWGMIHMLVCFLLDPGISIKSDGILFN